MYWTVTRYICMYVCVLTQRMSSTFFILQNETREGVRRRDEDRDRSRHKMETEKKEKN